MHKYFEKFEDLIRPVSWRSGMVINSPFEYLTSKKKLLMVGHNPGGVPEESNTTIKEDWIRHLDDPSFNALKESWGSYPEKFPGNHPIQLLYKAFLDNTSLTEEDILSTNVYWERTKSTELLKVDARIERSCKEGFLYNLEVHQPDCICFLGHGTVDVAGKWASVNLSRGSSNYPWGSNQKIKFQRMKFNGTGINTFSIPHPSRFGFGNDPERLTSILKALKKNGVS